MIVCVGLHCLCCVYVLGRLVGLGVGVALCDVLIVRRSIVICFVSAHICCRAIVEHLTCAA